MSTVEELQSLVQSRDDELSKLRSEKQKLVDAVVFMKKKLGESASSAHKADDAHMAAYEERIKEAEEANEALKNENLRLKKEVDSLTSANVQWKAERMKMEETERRLRSTLEQLEETLKDSVPSSDLEAVQQKFDDLEGEKLEAERALHAAKQQLEEQDGDMKERNDLMSKKLQTLEQINQELEAVSSEREETVQALVEELQSIKEQSGLNEELIQNIKKLEGRNAELAKKVQKLEEDALTDNATEDISADLQAAYETLCKLQEENKQLKSTLSEEGDSRVEKLEKDLREMRKENTRLRVDIQTAQNRYTELENSIEASRMSRASSDAIGTPRSPMLVHSRGTIAENVRDENGELSVHTAAEHPLVKRYLERLLTMTRSVVRAERDKRMELERLVRRLVSESVQEREDILAALNRLSQEDKNRVMESLRTMSSSRNKRSMGSDAIHDEHIQQLQEEVDSLVQEKHELVKQFQGPAEQRAEIQKRLARMYADLSAVRSEVDAIMGKAHNADVGERLSQVRDFIDARMKLEHRMMTDSRFDVKALLDSVEADAHDEIKRTNEQNDKIVALEASNAELQEKLNQISLERDTMAKEVEIIQAQQQMSGGGRKDPESILNSAFGKSASKFYATRMHELLQLRKDIVTKSVQKEAMYRALTEGLERLDNLSSRMKSKADGNRSTSSAERKYYTEFAYEISKLQEFFAMSLSGTNKGSAGTPSSVEMVLHTSEDASTWDRLREDLHKYEISTSELMSSFERIAELEVALERAESGRGQPLAPEHDTEEMHLSSAAVDLKFKLDEKERLLVSAERAVKESREQCQHLKEENSNLKGDISDLKAKAQENIHLQIQLDKVLEDYARDMKELHFVYGRLQKMEAERAEKSTLTSPVSKAATLERLLSPQSKDAEKPATPDEKRTVQKSVLLSSTEYQAIQGRLSKLVDENADLQHQLDKTRSRLHLLERQMEDKQSVKLLTDTIHELRQVRSRSGSISDDAPGANHMEVVFLREEMQKLLGEKIALMNRIDIYQAKVAQLETKLNMQSLTGGSMALGENSTYERIGAKSDQLHQQILQLMNERTELENEVTRQQQMRREMERRLRERDIQYEKLKNRSQNVLSGRNGPADTAVLDQLRRLEQEVHFVTKTIRGAKLKYTKIIGALIMEKERIALTGHSSETGGKSSVSLSELTSNFDQTTSLTTSCIRKLETVHLDLHQMVLDIKNRIDRYEKQVMQEVEDEGTQAHVQYVQSLRNMNDRLQEQVKQYEGEIKKLSEHRILLKDDSSTSVKNSVEQRKQSIQLSSENVRLHAEIEELKRHLDDSKHKLSVVQEAYDDLKDKQVQLTGGNDENLFKSATKEKAVPIDDMSSVRSEVDSSEAPHADDDDSHHVLQSSRAVIMAKMSATEKRLHSAEETIRQLTGERQRRLELEQKVRDLESRKEVDSHTNFDTRRQLALERQRAEELEHEMRALGETITDLKLELDTEKKKKRYFSYRYQKLKGSTASPAGSIQGESIVSVDGDLEQPDISDDDDMVSSAKDSYSRDYDRLFGSSNSSAVK